MPKEIITLQFGRSANFVGSHLWNFQDEAYGLDQAEAAGDQQEVDHSVLMRFSESQGYLSCSPRVLAVDLSGALGGNPSSGSVTGLQEQRLTTWGGPVAVHRAAPVPRSDFATHLAEEERQASERQWSGSHAETTSRDADEAFDRLCTSARQLQQEDAVGFWPDFLKAKLEPRSIWQVPGLWEGAAAFQGYGGGREALASEDAREAVAERIRWFAEECDHLQGFQVLLDDLSGFGSMAGQTLLQLQDDFPKNPTLAFPIRSSDSLQGEDERARRLSECLSLAEISPIVSLYCPLVAPSALPHATWPASSEYHRSALCATFLDTATLPTRLLAARPGATDLQAVSHMLGMKGSYVCGAASFPCPDAQPQSDVLPHSKPFTQEEVVSWAPHLPYSEWSDEVTAESLVLRGAQRGGSLLGQAAAASALDHALMQQGHRAVRQRCVSTRPLDLPLPFPQILKPNIQRTGGRGPSLRHPHIDVETIPVLTRMASAPAAVADLVARQLAGFNSMCGSAAGKTLMETWGYDASERTELQETLHSLCLAYQEGDSD